MATQNSQLLNWGETVTFSDREKLKKAGAFSMLSLLILAAVFAFTNGFSVSQFFSDLWAVFASGPSTVSFEYTGSVVGVAADIAGMIVVSLIVIIIVGLSVRKIIGFTKSYDTDNLEANLDKPPFLIFGVVLLEELVARQLFLGVLWPLLGGSFFMFWVLFLVGNFLFAVVHYTNFTDPNERTFLRVLPQFLAGIVFTFIFLKYGFWLVVLAHFYYNVILFSSMKEKEMTTNGAVIFGWYFGLMVVAFLVMWFSGLSLFDLSPWLTTSNIAPIEGYGFLDYFVVLIAVTSLATIVATLLKLDSVSMSDSVKETLKLPFLGMLIQVVISTVFFFGLNWVLSFFVDDVLTRTIVIAFFFGLIANTKSGSALARMMIFGVPKYFILVGVLLTLGFVSAMIAMLLLFITDYIPLQLHAEDN